MHVLIVGCGYLGLRTAQEWVARGDQVTALTRSVDRTGEWRALGIQTVVGDVLQPDSLMKLPDADVCLYAVGSIRSAPFDKRAVSVNGVRNVLHEIRNRVPRLIYISSTSVYGQDRGEIVNEDSVCKPIAEGGRICLAAEQTVCEFFPPAEPVRQAMILRLAGIYGPKRLIGRVDQLKRSEPISANPQAWLNLIHVDDAVQALVTVAEQPFAVTHYILSDNRPLRRAEFYGLLANLDAAPKPVFAGFDQSALNKRCDSSRILGELGLDLRYPSAREGLRHALAEPGD